MFQAGIDMEMGYVFNIVKRHNGEIKEKSSETDKGTSIEIIIPQSKKTEKK